MVLIRRVGCHLCDDVEAILGRLEIGFELVDVDADPELLARYSDEVPVVRLDGRDVDSGLIDPARLERVLRARLAKPPGRWRPW